MLDFGSDKSLDVGSSRIHHDSRRGGSDFPGIFWSGDEELDGEHLSPARHAENLVHPRANPLKLFSVANDPDEDDLSRSDCIVVEAMGEVTNVRELMGDTGSTRNEDNMTV